MIDRCCISLTERCNMGCRYCHFATEGRRSSDMTQAELDCLLSSILEYVRKNGIDFKAGIVGGGEPTLRPELLKHTVERLGEEPRIRMYTISNGISISDDLMEFLWEHQESLEFCVSLDGCEPLHDRNRIDREGNGTFTKVMGTIRRYEYRFGHKPSVNCTVTPEHLAHGEEVIRFFSDNGFGKVTFSRLFDSDEEVSEREFNDFLKKASESLEIRQLKKTRSYDCAQYGSLCGVGRTNIYFASGKVYPCGRFAGIERYCLGTVDEPFGTIESRLNAMTPCDDGECYYNRFVKIGGIQ